MNEIKAGKSKYVVAWLLMWVIQKILVILIEAIVKLSTIDPISLIKYLWLIDAFILTLSTISIFYLVYFKIFKTLDAKKVLIYIYILGSIGVLYSIGKTVGNFEEIGIAKKFDAFTYSWSIIVMWILSLTIVRKMVFDRDKSFFQLKSDIEKPDLRDSLK